MGAAESGEPFAFTVQEAHDRLARDLAGDPESAAFLEKMRQELAELEFKPTMPARADGHGHGAMPAPNDGVA